MSRSPGSNKAQVEERKREELTRFNYAFALDELAITHIRITQALERDPRMADLLGPGLEEIERVMEWIKEARCTG